MESDQSLFDFSLAGLIVGAGISYILLKHSKPTQHKYDNTIFGIDSGTVIRNILAFVIIAGFTGLLGLSSLNRDFEYISQQPIHFSTELLLFATLPAGIIFVMTVLRGHKINNKTWLEFLALAIKFGLMHILLQISGFYRYIYPPLDTGARSR